METNFTGAVTGQTRCLHLPLSAFRKQNTVKEDGDVSESAWIGMVKMLPARLYAAHNRNTHMDTADGTTNRVTLKPCGNCLL
jgi:hypothetical protein